MKQITTLLFLLFTLTIFSQEVEIKKYETEHQTGYFIKVENKWLRHGIWESQQGKAEYNKGQLVWIQPKGEKKWTREEIRDEQKKRGIVKS